jgi:putative nucleotidyltransferase with HDIG domain
MDPAVPLFWMDTASAFAAFRPLEYDPWVYLPPLLEAHHAGLGAHSLRSACKIAILARHLAMPAERQAALAIGALYHDVGKLYLPTGILAARRSLSGSEMVLVRRHVSWALRILREAPLSAASLDAIAHHHERWNGDGYPLGLAGTRIPFSARLLALVDVYDTLTHPRPYGPLLSHIDAMAELARAAGRQLDPGLVPLADLFSEDL